MVFNCPRCGAAGKGVLLFNSVAPCDSCYGIKSAPTPDKKENYTIHNQKELPNLGKFYQVALACGEDTKEEREYIESKIRRGTIRDYTWTLYANYSTHQWYTHYTHQNELCVVQWSE